MRSRRTQRALVGIAMATAMLCSCGWNRVDPPAQKSNWEELLGLGGDPDTQADSETLDLLRAALDSRRSDSSIARKWAFYCRDEIHWNNRYRIKDRVENSWMDDSRYLDIEFPTGPGLRLHPTQTQGQPGIAIPVYGDSRDTALGIADGNVDTGEFNRRKLPCSRQGPTDAHGAPLLRP